MTTTLVVIALLIWLISSVIVSIKSIGVREKSFLTKIVTLPSTVIILLFVSMYGLIKKIKG